MSAARRILSGPSATPWPAKKEEHRIARTDEPFEVGELAVHLAPRDVFAGDDGEAEVAEGGGDGARVAHRSREPRLVLVGIDTDDEREALRRRRAGQQTPAADDGGKQATAQRAHLPQRPRS